MPGVTKPVVRVDPRAGSKDLIAPLRGRGLRVKVERMEYADVAFLGRTEEGLVPVGIEHKKLDDVIQCITTGRFSHIQLPGLQDCYEAAWLLVEGRWKEGPNGTLLVGKGKTGWKAYDRGARPWKYSQVTRWLTTMEVKGGMHVRLTQTRDESVAFIDNLVTWWTAKSMDEHDAHLKVFDKRLVERVSAVRPSLLRKIAAQLPGVGRKRSIFVEDAFANPIAMFKSLAEQDVAAWCRVEQISLGRAKAIMRAIQ